jgi:hypothetical protein
MKQVPSPATQQAIVDANVDEKFDWRMLREVDGPRLAGAMRDAYRMNGQPPDQRVESFLAPLQQGLPEGAVVQIFYDASSRTTTLVTPKGRASVPGEGFMKATWRIWFGNIDQPGLTSEQLEDVR